MFKVEQFNGMAPRFSAHDLKGNIADEARNFRPWSGDVNGVNRSLTLQKPARSGVVQSIYYLDASFLEWNDDVDVVRSPLSGLWFSEKRFHYTGDYNPKSSNLSKAVSGAGPYPASWFRLGVPAPENGPAVANTGGSGPDETRSYVYTFVTAWGEEGPPSPSTEHTAPEDATSWDLTAIDQEPDNSFTIDSVTIGPGLITFNIDTTAHPDGHFLETGEYLTISSVTHYPQLNDTHRVTRIDKNSFSIPTPAGLDSFELVLNGGFSTAPTTHNQTLSVAPTPAAPRDLFFKPDGTRMFVAGLGGRIQQWDLSTAWDISTATRVAQSPSTGATLQGIFFKPDGTRAYVVASAPDTVRQYDLSTPWDITTGSEAGSFDYSSQETNAQAVFFKPDGDRFFILGDTNDSVFQYSMTVAWDVTSASYDSKSKSVTTEDTVPQGLSFKSDGTKMYVIGNSSDDVHQYPLSTAWDVSTAGAVESSYDVSAQDNVPTGIFWKPDGLKFYVSGDDGNTIEEYDVSVPWEVNSSGWTTGSGWTIGSGTASSAGANPSATIDQDIGAVSGVIYDTSFDVANYTSGQVRLLVGTGLGTVRTANGTYTEKITAGAGALVQARSEANPNEFTGDVDNISVFESPDNWLVSREAPIQISGMVKRIYRTDANGTFRFVAEIPVANQTYTDTVANEDVVDELISTTWIAPPGDMKGIIALPNGSLVGFIENQICFSEPYQPHAWPEAFRYTVDFEIVAIGPWGASVVVGTKGSPYLFTGVHPETMVPTNLNYEQACISKRSLARFASGVAYASADGVVFVGAGGARLITADFVKEPEWRLFNPASMHSYAHDDRYYAFYSNAGENDDENGAVVFDPSAPEVAFTKLTLAPTAGHRHPETDALYLIDADFISQYDAGPIELQTYWRSKVFRIKSSDVIRACRVRATFKTDFNQAEFDQFVKDAVDEIDRQIDAFEISEFGTFAGAFVGEYGVAMGPYEDLILTLAGVPSGLSLSLYRREIGGDDFVLHATEQIADGRAFILQASGVRFNEFYFELSGNMAACHSVELARSVGELKRRGVRDDS